MVNEEPKASAAEEKEALANANGGEMDQQKNAAAQSNGAVPEGNTDNEKQNPGSENGASESENEEWKIQNILLIEDDRVTQKLISTILGKKGFHVEVAENGRAALKKLQRFEPDLFIMDLNMPVMNGMELLQTLRKDKKYLLKPVIILTSQRDKDSIVKVANMGVDSYMAKPVKLDLLDQKLEEISRPESMLRRMLNLKNLLSRQINQMETQEKSLQAQIRARENQWVGVEKQVHEKIHQLQTAQNASANAALVKSLEAQMADQKANHQAWRAQVHKTLQQFQVEKKRLREDLKSIEEMLEKFQGIKVDNL